MNIEVRREDAGYLPAHARASGRQAGWMLDEWVWVWSAELSPEKSRGVCIW